MSRLRNLFTMPRYTFEVWSNGKLIGDGTAVNRLRLMREFEVYIDELHHNSESGDGFTFIVQKP